MKEYKIEEIFAVPVKRRDLERIFGCSDREARRIIAQLQEKYNIVNFQDGRGYFLADDETAIRYARQEQQRAKSALRKADGIIARCLGTGTGNVIPVRAHFRTIGRKNEANINQIQMEV